MGKLLYISLIGSTPKAVANSIYWCMKNIVGWRLDLQWDYVAIQTETSSINSDIVLSLLANFKERYNTAKNLTLPDNVYDITIPEADIINIFSILTAKLGKVVSRYNDLILFDITAGRKIMSSSLILTALNIFQKGSNKPLNIAYYLLKNFEPELKEKDAPQLYPDEIEVYKWPVKTIHDLVIK